MGTLLTTVSVLIALVLFMALAYYFWRTVWFNRDPKRTPPVEDGILSPADGTVVYVKRVAPHDDVVVIKQGLAAKVKDIVREDVDHPKIVIGIFMSPFNVHFNRMPLTATLEAITKHPGGGNVHMGPMHWRILAGRRPLYQNSIHIVQNERTVTRMSALYRAEQIRLYVVQIGAKTVNGIDSYFKVGDQVARGQKFGMIRIGSQVDLVLPDRPDLQAMVKAGDKVRGGETILVR